MKNCCFYSGKILKKTKKQYFKPVYGNLCDNNRQSINLITISHSKIVWNNIKYGNLFSIW